MFAAAYRFDFNHILHCIEINATLYAVSLYAYVNNNICMFCFDKT